MKMFKCQTCSRDLLRNETCPTCYPDEVEWENCAENCPWLSYNFETEEVRCAATKGNCQRTECAPFHFIKIQEEFNHG